jgi:hypothetical protein
MQSCRRLGARKVFYAVVDRNLSWRVSDKQYIRWLPAKTCEAIVKHETKDNYELVIREKRLSVIMSASHAYVILRLNEVRPEFSRNPKIRYNFERKIIKRLPVLPITAGIALAMFGGYQLNKLQKEKLARKKEDLNLQKGGIGRKRYVEGEDVVYEFYEGEEEECLKLITDYPLEEYYQDVEELNKLKKDIDKCTRKWDADCDNFCEASKYMKAVNFDASKVVERVKKGENQIVVAFPLLHAINTVMKSFDNCTVQKTIFEESMGNADFVKKKLPSKIEMIMNDADFPLFNTNVLTQNSPRIQRKQINALSFVYYQ